jgi:protein-tyrosine kinase
MSKIEKALDKARLSRQSIISATKERLTKEADQRPLVKTIEYTKTKIKEVPPEILEEKKVIATSSIYAREAEEYKLLKAQVMRKAREKQWQTIMITSVGKGEGKTLTAINLALTIAMEMHQTSLLVEADLKEPNMQRYFGLKGQAGLSDHLLGGTALPDCLLTIGIDRFVMLPGGKSIPNSAEILGSPRMQSLVAELRGQYLDRYVIFDLPPLLECADPLIFAEYVDAILLVVEAGKTTTTHAKKAVGLLEGKNILGTVLNKVTTNDKHYYRYYH